MNFNEQQSKEIYEFIMKYNMDEEFKNKIQQLYDNNTYQLSILQIYALEEILRHGAKGIFNKFLQTKGMYTEEQAVDLYDGFVKLLSEDANFKQYKMQQLKEAPETLSAMEMFAFALISNSDRKEQMHEEMTEELEYDPYNPILYATDNQIRETLENLFFGEFIHKMLELPTMKSIKARQKENGRIANVDKPFIIKKIQSVISGQSSISQFKQTIDSRYVKVKMDLLLGKGELAFEQYLKFNTNISSNEILGMEKDNSATDMYHFLMDMIAKRKEQEKEKRK
ncbi:MAG: hypothetical protein HFH31_03245 [Bacilli bacterium]|nr:hypothetical protein [Bacilli bacterium]